jgi:hypothetical protein
MSWLEKTRSVITMSQPPNKKRPRLSPRARVVLALAIIAFFVVLSFFLPHEQDSSTLVGDATAPSVTVTNLVSTLTVNRSVDFNNVHLTVTKVSQAAAFSDDPKHAGVFTVRVEMQAKSESGNQSPIGMNYPSLVRLLLPDGQAIAPKLISLAPVVLPTQVQSGYVDFPVNAQVDLSSLMLRLGSEKIIAFG